jgi:hypothetical protein
MSRGHSSSRRRSYGRRQTELRHRRDDGTILDADGPASWPRGSGWEGESEPGVWRRSADSGDTGRGQPHAGGGPR